MAPRSREREFNTDVLIIGAGVAGLSLAERLNAKGINNIVLESRSRIGGRIKSRRFSWGSSRISIPLGAEFIHWSPESGRQWRRVIEQHDFHIDDIGSDGQTIIGNELFHDKYDRPPRSSGIILELDKSITEHFARGGEDMDIASFVRAHPLRSAPDEDHMTLLRATLANEFAEDIDKLSLRSVREPDSYTTKNFRIHEGYGALVEALAQGSDIRVNTAVKSVRWEAGRVLVQTTRGTVLTARQCAITVPIGMLQRGIPAFEPLLPEEKREAIQQMLPGRVVKVIMKFRERFWSSKMMFLRGGEQQMSWAPALHHDQDAPFLSALIGGDRADVLADIGGGEAARIVANEIMKVHGIQNPKGQFVNGSVTAWHRKPGIMTAYSSPAIGAPDDVRERVREPVEDTLFFAGEHTSSRHPATVHGAMETGMQAAKEIVASRKRRRSA